MNLNRTLNSQGFTLIELLIATILIAIVMTGAYTSFQGSLSVWRSTAKSDLKPQMDARIALTMLEDDLRSIPTGYGANYHDGRTMLRGTSDTLEMVTVREPFDPELGESPRPMHISYGLTNTRGGNELRRTETVIESGLPHIDGMTGEISWDDVAYGKSAMLPVAVGVSSFDLDYWWYRERNKKDVPPGWVLPVETSWVEGEMPEGVNVSLQFDHENVEGEFVPLLFQSIVAFRQQASPMPRRLMGKREI
jgi:prepilin-type N-terminal cleavage/methylation domain-containing protein